jgi:hypothetical protein
VCVRLHFGLALDVNNPKSTNTHYIWFTKIFRVVVVLLIVCCDLSRFLEEEEIVKERAYIAKQARQDHTPGSLSEELHCVSLFAS